MVFSVNASWEAPPLERWNISSCEPVATFVAAIFLSAASNASQNVWRQVKTVDALEFAMSLVPDNWTKPSEEAAVSWYLDMDGIIDEGTSQALTRFGAFDCNDTICPHLNWGGDADLSGIGMMISYYVAAIFATIYYIMLAPELCQALGHSFFYSTGRFSRLLAAFAESLQGFMDATLLFAIAMLVAAVSRYARVVQHPDDSYSLFQLLDCVFLSTLAVFPGLVLQSLSHELRRRRIRLFLWLLVLAFAAAVDALYNARFLSIFHSDAALVGFASRDAEAAQAIWLAQCQDERLLNTLLAALKAAHVFMILNCCWWAYYVFASLGGSRYRRVFERREVFWRWWGRARLWMRLGNGLVCLVVMWVLLGTFTLYRHDVSHRAGGTDVDNEWTLGQILALVQWFPVGLDLVVVLMYGAKEGLTGKMSRKYKVVDRSKEDLLRDEEIGYDEYEQADGHDKNRADEKQSSRTQSWPRPLERSESWLDA